MSEESTLWIVAEDISPTTPVQGERRSRDMGGGFGSRVAEEQTGMRLNEVELSIEINV
ncbi:MAG: hypothetical protein MJA27_21125 [Pseudanabaenales cyanobacterium]|nr:hypothetical protein [Pseudanabaenales cyanobacterium]